jgi:hypothetical protein
MSTRRRATVLCLFHAVLPLAPGCGVGRDAGWAQREAAVRVRSVASAGVTAGMPMQWSGRLTAGQTLEVRTASGSIHAAGATGDAGSVEAKVRAGDGRPSPTVRFIEDERGVVARVDYPEHGDGRGCNDGDHGGVDFEVRAPAGVRLVVHSVNGSIDVDGVSGAIDARTVDGAIKLKSATSARARTVNGPIVASFPAADLEADCELDTVNGPVQVTLPPGANADLTASTLNGDVRLAFPLTGSSSAHRVHGTIGRGGHALRLKTVNGTIDVARGVS